MECKPNNVESNAKTQQQPRYKNMVHLWEFLLELLADDHCTSLINWSRQSSQEFKLKDKEEVARRWGMLKGKEGMNYEKLSRALRYYYRLGIIKKVNIRYIGVKQTSPLESTAHPCIENSKTNSTTGKYCSIAFIWMVTLQGVIHWS